MGCQSLASPSSLAVYVSMFGWISMGLKSIARDQRNSQTERMGGDHGVERADRHSTPFKLGSHLAVTASSKRVEIGNDQGCQESIQG